MYSRLKIRCGYTGIVCRFLSSAEISTALRPFYFSVHPDLFGKYPEQQSVNEYSLQQLSALIEAQQTSRRLMLPPLQFYLRQKDKPEGDFKLIKIQLNGNDVRETVVKVLNACDMSTTYIDKIAHSPRKRDFSKENLAKSYQEYTDEFEKASRMKKKGEEKKAIMDIVEWICENSAVAKEKYDMTSATREQVKSLIEHLCNTYGIKEVGKNNPDDFFTINRVFKCAEDRAKWSRKSRKADHGTQPGFNARMKKKKGLFKCPWLNGKNEL